MSLVSKTDGVLLKSTGQPAGRFEGVNLDQRAGGVHGVNVNHTARAVKGVNVC